MKTRWPYMVTGLAVIATILVCGAKTNSSIPSIKWEYKVVSHMKLAGMKSMDEIWEKGFKAMSFEGSEKLNDEIAAHMNQLGNKGWELVCYGKETGFVFKRMK